MQNKRFEPTEFLADPPRDTWCWNSKLNSWGISVLWDKVDFSAQTVNNWCATSLRETLEAFSDLIRIWRVKIVPNFSSDAEVIKVSWRSGQPYNLFVENVLIAIQEYPVPIYEITADVDLFVYVRFHASPNQPVRSWVRLPHNELTITSPQIKEAGLCLTIGYTLFGPANKEYGPISGLYPEPEEGIEVFLDDNKLQLLNQPLLQKSLQKWEKSFGAIDYVDGIPGIQKYGFLVEPY